MKNHYTRLAITPTALIYFPLSGDLPPLPAAGIIKYFPPAAPGHA